MLERNVDRILQQVGQEAVVLDVGGWAKPFSRANYVVDLMPYETRGFLGSQGPEPEHFSADTWIVHDISSDTPLPFGDDEIDFAICSHTLEDIRDPIFLCKELNRVAKAGYIEVPSRECESIMGTSGYVGSCHHRWLVEIEDNAVTFRFKSHLIHGSWKYHLPASYRKRLTEEEQKSCLLWEGGFEFREAISFGLSNMSDELEAFVRARDAYPANYYWFDERRARAKKEFRRFVLGSRTLGFVLEKLRGRRLGEESRDDFFREIGENDSR